MNDAPHFLLFSGTEERSVAATRQRGTWYFQLESTDTGQSLAASDTEPGIPADRLELLAVVRGLEALDQPSRVTLMTSSTEIVQGLREKRPQSQAGRWEQQAWGEKGGRANQDLWQRIERATRIHRVDCKCFRFDPAHARPNHHAAGIRAPRGAAVGWLSGPRRRFRAALLPLSAMGRSLAAALHKLADWLQRVLPDNSPTPHPMM